MGNFHHMTEYENIYEDLVLGEEFLASDQKAKVLLGMKSFGGAFEKMVNLIIFKSKISKNEISYVNTVYNINENSRLLSYIKTLESINFFEMNSKDNYTEIRILRNKATHDDVHYSKSSVMDIKKDAEEMYNLLVEETLRFTEIYLKKAAEKAFINCISSIAAKKGESTIAYTNPTRVSNRKTTYEQKNRLSYKTNQQKSSSVHIFAILMRILGVLAVILYFYYNI